MLRTIGRSAAFAPASARAADRENEVIRQAISCDICGAEKKQTNHWFVAFEQGGELRLTGWSSRIRQNPGTKHLCGQTCLHKLVDEYIARTIGTRLSSAPAESGTGAHREVDASLTSPAAVSKSSPAARVTRLQPIAEMPPARPVPEMAATAVVQFPPQPIPDSVAMASLPQPDLPQFASRRWRAEAWERERNRELRSSDRHFDLAHRRKGL
jgi:hypothetical protein